MVPPTSLTLPHGGTVEQLLAIGAGGGGRVYRGVLLGRAVGVKVASEGAHEALTREAIARAVVGNGAPIDAGFLDGAPFLAFEWVEGTLLAETSVDAAEVARDLGASLAQLHVVGYRHGDVKAENVVVSDGRASLIDFGLAAPFGERLIGGTPAILPPEILDDPDGVSRVGAEADLYALGLVLRTLNACDPLSQLLLAKRPGDRPSAAAIAGWESPLPLQTAYLLERLDELTRAARSGSSPPRGPANPWVAGLMRTIASLSGARADGAPLPPLDEAGGGRLLARLVGRSGWSLAGLSEEPLLARLAAASPALIAALTARDLRVVPDLDPRTALFRLACAPGDEGALAALAGARELDVETARAAVVVLKRTGLYEEALRLAEAHDFALDRAELLRLLGRPCSVGASDEPRARALRARLAIDRSLLDEASTILGDDQSEATAEARALLAYARGRFTEGVAILDAAVSGDPERRARALVVRGMIDHARGDARAALASFHRAADVAMALAAMPLEASARASAAAAAHDAGRCGDALDAATRAVALLERLGRSADASRARLTRAATLLAVGATTDALVEAERARTIAERAGDRRSAAYARFTAIEVTLETDATLGLSWLEQAREDLPHPTDAEAGWLLAYSSLLGAPVAERALTDAIAAGDAARWTLCRAALARGVRSVVDDVVRASDSDAPPSVVGPVLAMAIVVARESGRGEVARSLTERLAHLVSRLEEDLPVQYRASFAAMRWVSAARVSRDRSDDLGLGAGQIDLLASISRGLRDRTSLADLLRQVVDGLVLWVGVERGLLLLRAPDGVRLVPRVARGLSKDDLSGEQLALSTTLARRALDTLEPVVAVDASGDGDMSASIHALRLRSVLAVPLVARGEALGVVYLDDRVRRGAFGPREIAWVRLLATQAAAAIADARDALRLRRLARRAERARDRVEQTLVKTEGALEVARAELSRDRARSRHKHEAIVGDGEAIRKTLALVDRVTDAADARIPLLIFGESGTGKELIARAIHENGSRKRGPFVGENCGAIPEPLLESTLFGHVRGAFTGADRARIGLFEVATGGTLLLDEIGEMSLAMQAKLLRVLQEGEVRPVGSERCTKVDVRVIGATHRDLLAMVRDGRFREDLYYRLAVITIEVPPLRERSEDLPALVDHFLRKYVGTRKIKVTRAALAVLAAAPWPGNVRQLENELRRALLLCDDTLDVEHLGPELLQPRRSGRDGVAGLGLRDQLDALERRLLTEALRRATGNQTHAAKALGVSRFGLQKMMKRLGLPARE